MPFPLDDFLQRLRKFWYANARKIVIGLAGGAIFILGILSIVTPVPTTLVFLLGFALLASEFHWAKRFVRRGKAYLKEKLPDAHAARIDRMFSKVAHHSKNLANLIHHHVVKRLTPRRKRVKLPEPVAGLPVKVIPEPVKEPLD